MAGRAERQQFSSAPALVFMGVDQGMTFRLPRSTRMGNGLIGTGFVFVQLHNSCRFRVLAGQFNQSFFSNVSRS